MIIPYFKPAKGRLFKIINFFYRLVRRFFNMGQIRGYFKIDLNEPLDKMVSYQGHQW